MTLDSNPGRASQLCIEAQARLMGTVVGLTLLGVCTMAAAAGGLMPLLGKALKVDPAVFSNPFISTFVDATGLIIYFLIASAVLGI